MSFFNIRAQKIYNIQHNAAVVLDAVASGFDRSEYILHRVPSQEIAVDGTFDIHFEMGSNLPFSFLSHVCIIAPDGALRPYSGDLFVLSDDKKRLTMTVKGTPIAAGSDMVFTLLK